MLNLYLFLIFLQFLFVFCMEPGGSSSQQKDNSLQPPRPFPFEVFDQMLLEKAEGNYLIILLFFTFKNLKI
uniref:Uncharacterized protein n=1 Tax=Meloidogyne enterolobii TaxID=390850 RepID=A0A6V7URE4_MELEN|nr:unnamed protein product [Meloidogyne enterolobii]